MRWVSNAPSGQGPLHAPGAQETSSVLGVSGGTGMPGVQGVHEAQGIVNVVMETPSWAAIGDTPRRAFREGSTYVDTSRGALLGVSTIAGQLGVSMTPMTMPWAPCTPGIPGPPGPPGTPEPLETPCTPGTCSALRNRAIRKAHRTRGCSERNNEEECELAC